MIERVKNGEDPDMLLNLTVKTLSDKVKDSYQVQGDFTTSDAEMLTRLVRDTWNFSAAKNYQELRDLSLALQDENGKLREFSEFKEIAEGIIDKYNVTWLKTEYNFAIAASQNAARWTEFKKEADNIPNLKYQTAGDDHVRASHKVLDGIIRPINDSFWNIHYPPNGWGCRCEAVQSLEGYGKITDKIPSVDIPEIFKTNLAKTGLIYPKNHPYYTDVPRAELRKALAYLPPKNTFIDIVVGNHEIMIHPLHGEKELTKNIEAVNTLLNINPKAKIKLLPIISGTDKKARKLYLPEKYLKKYPNKNPDVLFNNRIGEVEVPNGSKTSIQNAIKHGKEQSDFILIHIPDDVDLHEADRAVKGQLKHYQGKEDLEIWIFNNTQKITYNTKSKRDNN
jgi:SPP1 gp7 family putative phage head morphogenesis protein